ncbi:hypothetical protein LIA77_02066 [Sarocladium implicatum]|nr:hypothetical protein LIA77_02066 [Sarocladium implicatum]
MKPTSHTLATPLLAASFVQAFSGMTIGRHIAAVDNADWADLLARANATSTIAVPFYDVSKNYSSRAQPSLDWEAKLSIVAGVPALGSDDEFFTLTQIELTPPESLRNDNNTYRVKENQWQTCENWLFQVNDRTSEEINPRCEGVLSKDCLESLQALSKLDNCVNVFPDSCQGDSDNHLGASNQAPVVSNGTYGLGYESSDHKPEKAGATKSYDDAIQKTVLP